MYKKGILNFKNQKGSVTLFVLIAVLFFTFILTTFYNRNMKKLEAQDRDLSKIQNVYDKDVDRIYEQTVEKFN